MQSIFGKNLQSAIDKSTLEQNSVAAREWLRNKAKNLKRDPSNIINAGNSRGVNNAVIGQMFLFAYDPKLKVELPYYDRYPLIFPIGPKPGGFLGINMHYLPLPMRAQLMDSLYDLMNNLNMDNTTRLNLSYQILNKSSKYKYFKPCVKHYLNNQVSSKLIYIEPKEWDVALFLPLQRFQKASTSTVHRDSRRIITKG